MNQISESPLVFLWIGIRPKMQVIRYLLAYLNLNYIQINIHSLKCQSRQCSQKFKDYLKKLVENFHSTCQKQNLQKLPLLVHEGNQIFDVYPIFNYICRKFRAMELLGRNPEQKAKVQELLQYFFAQKTMLIEGMFSLADKAADKQKKQILKMKKQSYDFLFNDTSSFRYMAATIQQQGKFNTYVLKNLTIIDFIFMQLSFMTLGIYGVLDQKLRCPINNIFINFFCQEPEADPTLKYLNIMRQYMKFMQSQDFYKNNYKRLTSHTIICQKITEQKKEGMRRLWSGCSEAIK